MSTKIGKIQQIIEPAVAALGYELVGCELISTGSRNLLRVYADSEKGLNIDDCARLSRQIGALLDVEDPISGKYILEVSSPGIERPLFTLEHYQRFVGHKVKLRLRVSRGKRRNFTGILQAVEGEEIKLQENEEIYVFPFREIEKARLIAF